MQLLWGEFSNVQADLESLDDQNDHTSDRIKFEDEFFDSTAVAKRIMDQYFMSLSQQKMHTPQTIITANNNANLPKIKLPEFHGSYETFLEFADTYKSLIHNNTTLSKIEKFWYLKSCLKGDAVNVLTALEVSEANYDQAWDILCHHVFFAKRIILSFLVLIF